MKRITRRDALLTRPAVRDTFGETGHEFQWEVAMAKIQPRDVWLRKWTAILSFFIIGMRVNQLWAMYKCWPVSASHATDVA